MSSIKAVKQTMFDEFQIKGHWWLPNSEEKKVSGIIFHKKDNIILELIGTISQKTNGMFDALNNNPQIILGYSDKGEEFTLLGATILNTTLSVPGFQTETYSIDSFFVGGHFNTIKEINFHSMEFYPTYFSKWIGKSQFTKHTSFENGSTKLKSIRFNEPTLFQEYIEPINSIIKEVNSSNLSGDIFDSLNWSYKGGFKIIPDELKEFNWMNDVMYRLRDLYSLLIGYPAYFERIVFYGDEENIDNQPHRIKYYYFQQQGGMKFKEKLKRNDVIVNYLDIHDNLNSIFNLWFDKQENLNTILDLYFSDFYTTAHLEARFLNSVQTLEIYHRRSYDGKLFDEDLYLKHSSNVIEYVKKELPDVLSSKIEGMLQHGNEYSLSKRLREIINNLESESKTYLIGNSDNRSRFIQQLVDTRNYLTHYDKVHKKTILEDTDEIFYTVQRLKALTTLILFKEIGVSEDMILSKIQASKQYSYSIAKAKELLNRK